MSDEYVKSWVDSFVTVPEILAMPDEDPDWIIRGLLRRGTYMITYGWQGSGKSSILYQLATKLDGNGGSWFGFDVEDEGNVLFLQVDMGLKESKGLLKRAKREGISECHHIYFPNAFGIIDVNTQDGVEVLEELQARFQPRLVVVDTATDAFEAKPEHGKDVNTPIRAAIRAFRCVFTEAGLIFVLHERRPNQYAHAKGMKDPDPVLGGGEWERKCSGSIRLESLNDQAVVMTVKKTRDLVPFKKITLIRNSNGFFEVDTRYLTPIHALALWPVLEDQVLEVPDPVTVSDVCRSIEAATGGKLKFDAIRKAYHRAKSENVEFGWEIGLNSDILSGTP